MVKEMTSYEIASFDHPFVDKDGEKATIQERLMWIESTEDESIHQFVNVTKQYNGSGIIFTFLPQIESDTHAMIVSLIPYFWWAYGDVRKYFKPEVWEMHRDTV